MDFFRSRGSFTHNMRTSSLARGPLLLTKWTFSGRITQTHTDLINGPLSKRASGPFYEVRANVLSFFRASVSRLARFARGPLFFHLESGGPKDIPAPLPKKWGCHGPPCPPPMPPPLADDTLGVDIGGMGYRLLPLKQN